MNRRILFFLAILSATTLVGQIQAPPIYGSPAKWHVRFYPVALVTGVKAEVGHQFTNGYELNVQGKYIYQGFFWYRTYKAQLPTVFFKPADGYRIMVSYEKRGGKHDLFAIGPKVGYEFISSDRFDVSNTSMSPGQAETIQMDRDRYVVACIGRFRSRQDGFYIEFSAELGLSYNETTTRRVFVNVDYIDHSQTWASYVMPHALIGFAIGFGY